jgi:hypothetical protein
MFRLPLLTAALLAVPCLAADEKAKDSPYYPLAVGNTWVYAVGETTTRMRVTRHEKVGDTVCALIETERDGKVVAREHIAATGDGVYRYTANGTLVDQPVCILRLPPKPGDTWKIDTKVGNVSIKGNFTTGSGKVEVPAGKYTTVTTRMEDGLIGEQKISFTYHFAEGVGMVKQTAKTGGREFVLELKSFEKGK